MSSGNPLTDTWQTHRKHLPSSGAHLTVLAFQIYSDFKYHCSKHIQRTQCTIVFSSTKKQQKPKQKQNKQMQANKKATTKKTPKKQKTK